MSVAIIAEHLLARAVGSVLFTGTVYRLAFPERTDYLGHYLAGFGATLALLSLAFVVPRDWRAAAIATATLVAVALGWGTEETIFKLAIFDPVDFFNQSLGAVVAAAVVLGDRGNIATGAWAFVFGFVTLIAGFYFAFA